MIVDNLEFHVKRTGDTAAKGTDRLSKSLRKLKNTSRDTNKGMGGLLHTIGRLAKMMVLRQIIRSLMQAMKEGLKHAYAFNSMVGGEMSAALDRLKSAAVQTQGALGSVFGEIIASVAPILIRLLNLITRVANAFAQLMAVLGGRSTYTKAIASSEKWADATSEGAKSAKEWKNQLMGFDEINRLEDSSDTSGGGGGKPYDGAFELAPAVNAWASELRRITMEWWKGLNLDPIINAWDRLKKSLAGLADVIDDYLYYAYTEILLPLGTWTIEEGLPAAIHALASAFEFLSTALEVLKPVALWIYESWLQPLADWVGDHFVWAMWRVQDAFVRARQYLETLAGLSPTEIINKLWNDLIHALQNVNWQGLGAKIVDMLSKALQWVKDKITSASFAKLVEKAAEAAGTAIGAALGIVWGALLELLQKLLNKAIEWSSNMEEAGTNLIVGLFQGIWNKMKGIAQWIDEHIFAPFINALKEAFGIHSPSTVMEGIGSYIIQGLWNGILDNFAPLTNIINTLSGFFENLGQVAHGWLQNIIDGLNHVIGKCVDALRGLNQVGNMSVDESNHRLYDNYGGGYATGGFPDEGELFMAREGGMPELVGRIGNHTAVANNDQIVQGISAGVFNAVVSAMGQSGGNDKNIDIYLDGALIAKSTTKYQKQYARAGTM